MVIEWQIFDSAKKYELKKVDFCAHSIIFWKIGQMMICLMNCIFLHDFQLLLQAHFCWMASNLLGAQSKSNILLSKKSELKKVSCCASSILYCDSSQNEFRNVVKMEFFPLFFVISFHKKSCHGLKNRYFLVVIFFAE